MNLQVIKNKMFRWIRRIILYGAYSVFIFFITSLILLQLTSVQNFIIGRFTNKISEVSDFSIQYESIYAYWWDRLEVTNLTVKDPKKYDMLKVGELQANFSLLDLVSDNNINFDGVVLSNSAINLVKLQVTDSTRDINFNIFINELNRIFGSGKTGGNPPKFNIGEIVINDTNFALEDPLKDTLQKVFDYNHIRIHIDEAEAQNFKLIGDTIELRMNSMIATETNANLPVHNFSSFFRISQQAMEFYNLQAKVGESYLGDTLVFKYKKLGDLSDFNQKVNLLGLLKDVALTPQDLSKFTGGREVFDQTVTLNGKVTGKISRLLFQNMNVETGETTLSGKLELDGLPSVNDLFINLDVKKGKVVFKDFDYLLPAKVYERLSPLGKFDFQGKFTGFIDDFVADGVFEGPFGYIASDINLKIDRDYIDRSKYEGNLTLTNFELGNFLNDSTFKKVSMSGKIKGRGLTQETADFNLTGKINSVGILNYTYTNIETDARFAKENFSGKLSVDDPNLQVAVNGSLDIRKGKELIKMHAVIDSAYIDKLGLVKDPLFIHSVADIDTKGILLDSLFGTITLKDTYIEYKKESLMLDSIFIDSYLDGGVRNLNLKSSYADILMKGNFYYTSFFSDVQRFVKEFQLNFINNKEAIANYYKSKPKTHSDYGVSFAIKINNINPILKLADTEVKVSNHSTIDGKFQHGINSQLNAYSKIDTVYYQDKVFINNEFDFSGSKISDSTAVLAMLSINSESQNLGPIVKTSNLFSEAIWDKDHIDVSLDIDQVGTNNLVRLNAEIDFLSDSTRIKMLPGKISIFNEDWVFNRENYLLTKGKEWFINQLSLTHENEEILVNGFISQNKNQALTLTLHDFNVDIFNSISTTKLSGIVNGKAEIKDIYQNFYLQNDITINALTADNFLIGDIVGTNIWNREDKRFDINFTIDRLTKRTLTLQGYYNPGEKNPLHVIATLEKTNVKIIEPFLKGIFSEMDGTLSGIYRIEGNITTPLITGNGIVENGKIKIDYLKTLYSFEGQLRMTPTDIIFENFIVKDNFNNNGNLDGYLKHRNFSKWRINLDATFDNLQVLNTTAKDNSLFYGTAYGTGKLNMLGPLSNMKISATARTNKNTRIFIPISGLESVEKSEFISFVNFSDSLALAKKDQKVKSTIEPTGFTLDLNLDITPDAYAEIIFDIKAGDIIRGYGNGDIKLQLDTKGEFNMFGIFEFEQGNYNFTLYDIINKEFAITKGSRISWYGDPYEGVLNVSARYRQLASLVPILQGQVVESALAAPSVRRKYPAEVILKLDGPMLSPQIQFDITAKDLPDNIAVEGSPPVRMNFLFNAWKSLVDDLELQRQVFSLIVLRRFSPRDAFSTNGSIYNSVSELLSNQLSYWLTQVDENLEVNLDLGSMDTETFNTFQLRLSYSFLNGRLRVTREGTFNNQNNRSETANMLGDWTIDYLLTPDGKFKVKMYSRSNFNSLNNTLGTQAASVTTGISLLHTQNFNQLKDLLVLSRNRRRQEIQENQEQEAEESQENK